MTELPHTRTRMVHWLGTAVALAAVVGAAALVQPSGASAGPVAAAAAAPGSGTAPDAGRAHYPVDCGSLPWTRVDVVDRASADFDGDGRSETVAVVRCHSETGTPPSGLFVLARPAGDGERPRVAATLVPSAERMTVEDLKVGRGTISATLLGYSSPDVPSCCPDKQRTVRWQWRGGRFALEAEPAAGTESV